MVEQLAILIANPADLIADGYTTIEVWQSKEWRDGDRRFPGTDYCEITAAAVASATLTSLPAQTLFRIGGKELRVIISGGPLQTIDFSSFTEYWTPTQVVTQINSVVAGLASLSEDTLSVILTAPTTGRASSLFIPYNDATQLGFSQGTLVYGQDARIALSGGTTAYSYTDLSGNGISLYKWRYSANGVNPISNFGEPVRAQRLPAPGIAMALATARFVNGFGVAVRRKVIVSSLMPQVLSGAIVGDDRTETFCSDEFGNLQIPLVQGAQFRVAIEGTGLIRDILVPTGSGTPTFDLLSTMEAAPDAFTVQTPPPLLTRTGV